MGTIATRNSCRDGWSSALDLRLSRVFRLGRGLRMEAVLDGFNVLNGIDGDWGRQGGVIGTSQSLLTVRGFDPGTGRYIYAVNGGFGLAWDLAPLRVDHFGADGDPAVAGAELIRMSPAATPAATRHPSG